MITTFPVSTDPAEVLTMNFGDATDEPTAYALMDHALEVGINLFDTADVYGGPQSPAMAQGYGLSEEIIGRRLQQDPARRGRGDFLPLLAMPDILSGAEP
jgi:aryl-alcohol dehydrogenase-like predicted oxidoreductase